MRKYVESELQSLWTAQESPFKTLLNMTSCQRPYSVCPEQNVHRTPCGEGKQGVMWGILYASLHHAGACSSHGAIQGCRTWRSISILTEPIWGSPRAHRESESSLTELGESSPMWGSKTAVIGSGLRDLARRRDSPASREIKVLFSLAHHLDSWAARSTALTCPL